ncbi:hypothetical protein CHUAL_009593 [Chamberlinius hualienensis]
MCMTLMDPEIGLFTVTPTISVQPQVSVIPPAAEVTIGAADPVQTLGRSSDGDTSNPWKNSTSELEWPGELFKQEPLVETSSPVQQVLPCAVQLLLLLIVVSSGMPMMVTTTMGSTSPMWTLFPFQLQSPLSHYRAGHCPPHTIHMFGPNQYGAGLGTHTGCHLFM